MITHTIDNCKYCNAQNSIITDFSAGQVVCSSCGAVLEDRIIDETYEGRNFGSENQGSGGKDQTRVGGPINAYTEEINAGVSIATKKNGTPLSNIRMRSSGSSNNSLQRIFKKADELAQKLELKKSIVDKAKDLLALVEKQKKLKGRSLDCIIASVIYVACRLTNVPRPLPEIAKNLGLEKKTVNKCFNSIKHIIIENNDNQIAQNVSGLVNSYCNKLEEKLKKQENQENQEKWKSLKKDAMEISEMICNKEVIAGRNPNTIAAVSILIASRLNELQLSKKDIADTTTTTENTISNAYQDLLKYREHIIPDRLKDKMNLFI